jgi:hypothetical protein
LKDASEKIRIIRYLEFMVEHAKINDTYIGYDYNMPSERTRGMQIVLDQLKSGEWEVILNDFLEEEEEE